LEQQDLNKRLILALALSFLVFMGYSYLFSPTPQQQTEQAQQVSQTQNATPNAPKVADATTNAEASQAP
jgi:YidC/Oxa1 family membrane protein insertase